MVFVGLMVGAYGARPVVFLTETQVKEARRRIGRRDWARRSYDVIKASAERRLKKGLDFPEGPTGWYHDYFCPEHGVFLRYDEKRPHEHYCSAGKHYVRGEKFDAYWRAVTLRGLGGGAKDMATVTPLRVTSGSPRRRGRY